LSWKAVLIEGINSHTRSQLLLLLLALLLLLLLAFLLLP